MKFIVNYFPEEINEEKRQLIRDNISPSLEGEESSHYATDMIAELFPGDEQVQITLEGCDYIEI